MFGSRGWGLLWALLTVLVAAGAAFFAYQAGVATHLPAPAAGGAPGPYYGWGYGYPGWGWGFGFFHLFGFLFFLLLLFFVLRLVFGGRHWRGMHDHRQEHFEEMHRRAHGEPPAKE